MTDKSVATIGRRLAVALMRFGKTREPADKAEVLRLETALCHEIRTEAPEQRAPQEDE